MNRHRQSITGPVLKTPEELKELILRNDRFQKILKSHAETQNKEMGEIYREADGYLNDIAADYSPGLIQMMSVIIGWIWKTMYDGITLDMEGLHRVKRAATRAPLVFVPCHKSHFDYLILNYLLFTNNMPCPHVAAGRNMAFWPMGTLFRKSGAFFLRRTFRGAKLYAAVFAAYVQMLIEQGVNIEFFIEGGRSRTGKLVLPKRGLVSILLEAFKNEVCRDLLFVPVYIGYDRLLEEGAILKELEGRSKEKESFWQLMQARKVMKKRHGRVYVQFAEPISVRDLACNGPPCNARHGSDSIPGLRPQPLLSDHQRHQSRNRGHRPVARGFCHLELSETAIQPERTYDLCGDIPELLTLPTSPSLREPERSRAGRGKRAGHIHGS